MDCAIVGRNNEVYIKHINFGSILFRQSTELWNFD